MCYDKYMSRSLSSLFILTLLYSFIVPTPMWAAVIDTVTGYIVLQVEENGEAWYVDPSTVIRYYLGRPDDAFSIMR